jgi:hypothetical protein
MNCDDLTNDVLADLCGGTLDAEAKARAEAHLASCEACRRRAEEVRAVLGAARGWGAGDEVPGRVEQRLAEIVAGSAGAKEQRPQVAAPPRGPAWARVALPVAVAFMGLVLGYLVAAVPGIGPGTPGRATLEKRLLDAEGRVGRMEADAAEIAGLARAAGRQAASAKADRDRVASQRDALLEELRKGQEARISLETRLSLLGDEVTALQKQVAEERLAAEGETALRLRTEAQMAKLVENVSVQLSRLEAVQDRFDALSKEQDSLRGDLGVANAEAAALKARNEELESALRVRGDADGDRHADVRDALAICRARAAGREFPYTPAADLNGDGRIDVGDAMLILREAAAK